MQLVLLQDAIVEDGLTDAYKRIHMGLCAEKTAEEFSISREEQDSYAIQSYKKTASAWMVNIIEKNYYFDNPGCNMRKH